MDFIQDFIAQEDWIQYDSPHTTIVTSFRLYDYVNQLREFSILKSWTADFLLPSFDASKLLAQDTDLTLLASMQSQMRDLNLLQSSSYVLKKSQWEHARQAQITAALKIEVVRCLSLSIKTLRVHVTYTRAIATILTETNRIFLAGSFSMRQLTVESRAKDKLFNLEATKYGCVVMASILHGGKWLQRTAERNNTQRGVSVASYGVMGAQAGFYIYGPVGAAVGAVIGIVVGIALNFYKGD